MSDLAMDDPVELPAEPAPPPPGRPADVPEKFWDETEGAVRLDGPWPRSPS